MLNSYAGQVAFSHARWSNNRSVMPLDVRGCTRATMGGSACVYPAPRGAGNPPCPLSTPAEKTIKLDYREEGRLSSIGASGSRGWSAVGGLSAPPPSS
uniref:Uncharacterized protein n=1 Tax=Cyprinus carpio carpio TaxID=630221 RepID=A0A9J7ZA51_CYPCA